MERGALWRKCPLMILAYRQILWLRNSWSMLSPQHKLKMFNHVILFKCAVITRTECKYKMQNKKLTKISLIIAISIVSINLQAQVLPDSISSLVSKNIISFHFRYALDYDLFVKKDLLLTEKHFFEDFWVGSNKKLNLEQKKIELKYPVLEFNLFQVWKKHFQFSNDSITRQIIVSSLPYDELYLVAIGNKTIKFISGNFFKTRIAEDFNLNEKVPDSFTAYLSLKYYNIKPVYIRYKRKFNNKIYYLTKSGLDGNEFIISVDTRDYDLTQIEHFKSK